MKISFKDVVSRITGISTPIFGVSWDPPEPDKNIVRRVLFKLEDRRALFYPYELEVPTWVETSIIEIRRDLSDALGEVDKDSVAGEAFVVMRRACREFLDTAQQLRDEEENYLRGRQYIEYFMALGKLRGIFGIQIARLSVAYGVDIENELSRILPPAAEDNSE